MNNSSDFATSFLLIFGSLLSVSFVALYIWSILWSYKDAEHRGKNGFAVAFLVAFFAWPFGALLWMIFRPEIGKKSQSKQSATKSRNIVFANFKEMTFLLKIIFLLSIYSLFEGVVNLILMKPIEFSYFGTNFPKNYPLVWYTYNVLFNLATIVVYIKKSFSVLTMYIYVSLGVLAISLFNSIYSVMNLPVEQRMPTALVYAISYIFGGLVTVYLFGQKKYFNKP